MSASPKKPSAPPFDTLFQELTKIVEKMEAGGLSLEDSIAHFEKGVALTERCQQSLQAAEQKVHILMEKHQKAALEPYDPTD